MTSDMVTGPGIPGGLRCPACGDVDTSAIDTRTRNGNRLIRRRRKCMRCDHRFTTYELEADALRALQTLPQGVSDILDAARSQIAALTRSIVGGYPLGTSGDTTSGQNRPDSDYP